MAVLIFADEKTQKNFEKLKSKDERLLRHLQNAINNIKEEPQCGIKIPQKLIPKDWIRI